MSDDGYIYDGTDNLGKIRFYQIAPFYPKVTKEPETEGQPASYKIEFNRAYVFDYRNGGNKIKVDGDEFTIKKGEQKTFYVKLTIDVETGKVSSASIQDKKEGQAQVNVRVKTSFDQDSQSSPAIYYLDLAKFDGNGLQEIYLRDNIHWWMQVFEQLSSPSDGNNAPVLVGSNTSSANSRRQFRAIARENREGNILEISYDSDNIYLYVSPHSNESGGGY